jgi:hypothetical protein
MKSEPVVRSTRGSCSWPFRFAALTALLVACGGDRSKPTLGSNSNWLTLCDRDADCGGEPASCRCGACANECDSDSDCGEFDDARCAVAADSAIVGACFEATSVGMCLPRCSPGGCDAQMPCVAGTCVPISLPSGDLCDAEAERDADERRLEDELLDALAEMRAAGGVTCGDNSESLSAPTLVVDARLWCSARVLARDLAQTGERLLIDSLGRSTEDRLQLVGYDNTRWGETLSFAGNATTALQGMLSSESACLQLTAFDLVDVGVGASANVGVITLASPQP